MMEEDTPQFHHASSYGDTVANRETSTNVDEADDTLITLNVGGCVIQTKAETLRRRGVGRLSRLTRQDGSYMRGSGQYFFDRDPEFFTQVIRFYRTGELHIPENFCSRTVSEEMQFWDLKDSYVAQCCWQTYSGKQEQLMVDRRLAEQFMKLTDKPLDSQKLGFKAWIRNLLECPTSSLGAKVWTTVSVTLLLISILCYALATLPEARQYYSIKRPVNGTEVEALQKAWRFVFIVTSVDIACLTVFTMELMLRLYAAPNIGKVVKSFLFVCDLLFLVPGWVLDIIVLTGHSLKLLENESVTTFLIHFVSITRLFRIIRLAWVFRGVRILLYVIKASLQELGVLVLFLFMGTMVYGFLIYSAEVSVNDSFDSAFRGFWWAIVTMTTVGYGDTYPVSLAGYIIAALCAITGLILIAMPISIIANNFHLYYGFRERDTTATDGGEKKSHLSEKTDPQTISGKYKMTDSAL